MGKKISVIDLIAIYDSESINKIKYCKFHNLPDKNVQIINYIFH